MRFVFGHLFDGDGTDAGGLVDANELFGGGILSGNEHVAEKNGERFVADEIARDEHSMAEAKRLLLARVADLHHVVILRTSSAWSCLPFSSRKRFQRGSGIEMVFDRILALAGDDDDVLDAGGDALFGDVLNLGLSTTVSISLGCALVAGGSACRGPRQGGRPCGRDFARLRACVKRSKDGLAYSLAKCGEEETRQFAFAQ